MAILGNTKIYAEVLEDTTIEQFESAMSQPFVTYGALMPDAHTGYSLPIGAVVATKDVVLPAWVGYDIGCGMCALRLDGIHREELEANSKGIFDLIYKNIPVGFNTNSEPKDYNLDGLTQKGKDIATKKKYGHALGSLGGGNHFIEIGHDEEDNIWVVIHSGSRGVGHGIAAHYMTVASSDPSALEAEFDDTHTDLLKHNPDNYDRLKANYVAKKTGRLRPKEGHYEPLIPANKVGRHLFWSNFEFKADDVKRPSNFINMANLAGKKALMEWLGIHYEENIYYEGNHCPAQILRNCVHPDLGLQIFEQVGNAA